MIEEGEYAYAILIRVPFQDILRRLRHDAQFQFQSLNLLCDCGLKIHKEIQAIS